MVEKPAPKKAPSTLSIIGRYILQPEVFDHLARIGRGAGGEIQLTDALAELIGSNNALPRPALRGPALRLRRQGRVPAGQHRLRAGAPRHGDGGAAHPRRVLLTRTQSSEPAPTAARRRPSLRSDHPARIRHSRRRRRDAARGGRPRHRPQLRRASSAEAGGTTRRGRPRRAAELARARGGAGRGAGASAASTSCASGSVRRRCSISPSTRWASTAGSW